jgi:lipid II:glycine glycyltransferase (peptidoglycan interpeptide bridge formation enzyme)
MTAVPEPAVRRRDEPGAAAGDPGASPATDEPAAWDAFVEAGEPGSYLQLSGWAAVKAVNGWTARRVAATAGRVPVGAQVLLRRPRPLPWAFAYAPRGPVTGRWSADTVEAFSDSVRADLTRAGRVSHLRIDPEIERDAGPDAGGAIRASLRQTGWRPATPIQPNATRIIDLAADEEALWGDLRKKWRQYVNKARNAGIVVSDGDGSDLPEFYRVYRETADRAGFLIRTEAAYRDVWDAYSPRGNARLLFARNADREALATLFLIRCGPRVVEPYGGMTAEGGDSRANYLLKWEAIRSSREAGATSYDLWGLATGGIAHFKTGFGGREVHYLGAWDLVLDPLGRQAYERGQGARVWWARRRHGLDGATGASAFTGGDAA